MTPGWWLAVAWITFFGTFYWSHRKVRARPGPREERRVRRERSSDAGMALQFLAVLMACAGPGPSRPWLLAPGMAIAAGSIWLVRSALRHLGRQWRVQAVVTDDHELITTGPYGVVRHPVYLAFLGMVAATALVRGHPWSSLAAVLVFIAGTEIRVRAEERLLAATFQDSFAAYIARTRSSYLPGLR